MLYKIKYKFYNIEIQFYSNYLRKRQNVWLYKSISFTGFSGVSVVNTKFSNNLKFGCNTCIWNKYRQLS